VINRRASRIAKHSAVKEEDEGVVVGERNEKFRYV